MKKIGLIIIFFISLTVTSFAENYIAWGTTSALANGSGTTNSGTAYSCMSLNGRLSTDIWSVDSSTGAIDVIGSFDSSSTCSVGDTSITWGDGSYYDGSTGYIYMQNTNGTKVYDTNNNASLVSSYASPTWNKSGQFISVQGVGSVGVDKIVGSNGSSLIETNSDGTSIQIGTDNSGESGLIISNTPSALDVQDGDGKTIIKVTSDGATHIGENSLVSQEVNGVQQLYATDESGNQIDINIKSGTNLLIDGTNIMSLVGGIQQDISGSVALSSALAALPNSSPDAFYTCGLGTGIHDSSSALSAGCASDFSNYAFTDNLPKFFQTASFNIGSSFLMNGEPDISEARDMSIKAGITFKFGSVKPTRVADKQNHMLENKIDAVMAENDLLKAQIAEINTQLKALNMLAMN